MNQVSAENIERQLKSSTEDELRRNRETRANYWRELSLVAKVGPFPIEAFIFIVLVLLFPTYYTAGVSLLFATIYTIARSKGLNMMQLLSFVQSLLRGRTMTPKITFLGYDIR